MWYACIYLQDYVYDLLGLLDIFHPFKKVMEALQSYSITPSKGPNFIEKLLEHLALIDFRSNMFTPMLSHHLDDLKNNRFEGEIVYSFY